MKKQISNEYFSEILFNIKNKLNLIRNKDRDLIYSEICLDSAMLFLEICIPDLEQCILTRNMIEKYFKNEINCKSNFIYQFYNNERESLEDDF